MLISRQCVIIPMPAIEGSYATFFATGPSGHSHPDLPALRLAASLLNALESYLWKSIRGSGLAYGAHVMVYPEAGLVGFNIYRVSPGYKAGQHSSLYGAESERYVGVRGCRQDHGRSG